MNRRLVGAVQGRATVAALLLLATFVLRHAGSMQRRTLTIDESGHYAYGWRLRHFDSRRVDPLYDNSKMPFSMLNALPRRIVEAVLPRELCAVIS